MIARVKVAMALLGLVGATLAVPAIARAEAPAIEQSAWPAMKNRVKLANGITLAYVEFGNPKGEPLLLLHGYRQQPHLEPTPVDPVFAEAVRAKYMTIPSHVWRGVMRELASVPPGATPRT